MKPKPEIPFSFVLDELQESAIASRVWTRAMFGSRAVYVDEKIVFILRRKLAATTQRDNGVWISVVPETNSTLRRDLPTLRPIEMFQVRSPNGFQGWLNLPEHEEGFEEAALKVCRFVIEGDPRIGKVPKRRNSRN